MKYIGHSAKQLECCVLAMREAKAYDLDTRPVEVKRWHELEGIRVYYNFFRKHADKFEG